MPVVPCPSLPDTTGSPQSAPGNRQGRLPNGHSSRPSRRRMSRRKLIKSTRLHKVSVWFICKHRFFPLCPSKLYLFFRKGHRPPTPGCKASSPFPRETKTRTRSRGWGRGRSPPFNKRKFSLHTAGSKGKGLNEAPVGPGGRRQSSCRNFPRDTKRILPLVLSELS